MTSSVRLINGTSLARDWGLLAASTRMGGSGVGDMNLVTRTDVPSASTANALMTLRLQLGISKTLACHLIGKDMSCSSAMVLDNSQSQNPPGSVLSNVLSLSIDSFIFNEARRDHLGSECHAQVHARWAVAGLMVPQDDRR